MKARVPVYILAGGRSSRFGSDKARAVFGGAPLILRVARLLEPAGSSITVVADRPGKYDDLGLRTIADAEPGLGPLTGLATALTDMGDARWLMICSCDAVVVRANWLTALLARRNPGAHAVAFRAAKWQPMPALFAMSSLPFVQSQLHSEDRSMQRLLDDLRAIALPMPADWPDCWQVNRPNDLDALAHRDRTRRLT